MADPAFQLSRVFAKGWAAARVLSAQSDVQDIDKSAEALNPYPSDPEKARWREGFLEALSR